MIRRKKIIFILITFVAVLAVARFAMAATLDLGINYAANTGLANTDPRTIVANIINIALACLGIIAIVLLIYGGFVWMTAGGDEKKVDTAKRILVSALIGLAIILASWGIATFVLNSLLNATGNGSLEGGPCDNDLNTPGCQMNSALCSPGLTCGNDCQCHSNITPPGPEPASSCNGTTTPGVCQDNGTCDSNHFCDAASSCTCQPLGNLGDPCDGNLVTAGCQPVNSCQVNLACDNNTCKCTSSLPIGQPCSDNPNVCSPNSNLCPNDQACDASGPTACTCQQYPMINWVSPVGGFCANAQNAPCTKDTDCPASTCNISNPNAALGNIITIGGQYFGNTPGTVEFFNGTVNNIPGVTPVTVNPNCVSYWTDNQIIIVVPPGAKSGPIRVLAANNKADQTNDSFGPTINDLVVNTIIRPGLCLVTPTGKLGDTIFYNGVNFGNGNAGFGVYNAPINGVNSVFAASTGATTLPNLRAGETTTFVKNPSSGQNSNYLNFGVLATPAPSGSFISSFSPSTGTSSQYVTINGNGFGNIQGTSKVYFGNSSGVLADLNFPAVCADSIWSDKQIIVKVPAGINPNFNDILTIVLDNGETIDTTNSTPHNFAVDKSAPLLPSLCKISPTIGLAGTAVNLWGEYFDPFNAINSAVRFSPNQNVTGAALTWDGNNRPNAITTAVPQNAASGLVQVVKSSPALVGNGLNFYVGSCLQAADPDAACGGQHCCPSNTYKAGACVNNVATDCVNNVANSVYEFNFSTNITNNPPNPLIGSCQEKSNQTGACDPGVCPNSPGWCSLFAGGGSAQSVGSCANSVCDGKAGCPVGVCVYDSVNNKCVDGGMTVCGLASTTKDNLNQSHNTYCATYNGVNRYVYDYSLNCSNKYNIQGTILKNGENVKVCVNPNSLCSLCANAAQSCIDDGIAANHNNHLGVCGSTAGDICPAGSSCVAGVCQAVPPASCSCCCRKANQSQDCCAGLTCEGACGSDVGSANPTTFGSCGGCKTAGGNQASWDSACNCLDKNTTGKFCDINDPDFPSGVCRDCAALTNNASGQASCTQHNACCVDYTKDNDCVNRTFGIKTTDIFTIVPDNGINYCGYYQCNNVNTGCESTVNPVSKPTNAHFASSTVCSDQCGQVTPLLGASCAGGTAAAPNTCATNICGNPLSCLQANGNPPVFSANSNTCGVCCCNPAASGQCDYLTANKPNNNLTLSCVPNVGPCDGAGRGLCCGCKANSDCSPANTDPQTEGCGFDTCCRTRPAVVEPTVPASNASDVCTNASLSVSFNQKMDISSFNSNNFILIEELSGDCPVGTEKVAIAGYGKENFIVKTFARLLSAAGNHLPWIFGQETLADQPAHSIGISHCSIPGSVSGQQVGENKTILTFQPTVALDSDKLYFAVVRGIAALSDNGLGVRNFWGIGMNVTSTSAVVSPVLNSDNFSGVVFKNSYIWSFRTKESNGEDDGICAINHLSIYPDSYLFNTTGNALNENDIDPLAKTFDTAYDRDKMFNVSALSGDGQVLHPVVGYSWDWNWTIANNNIARIINNADQPFAAAANSQLIQAQEGIVNNRTTATAQINLIDTTISSAGAGLASTSDIYVFICTTTWPDLIPNMPWYPWRDQIEGAACTSGACQNTNYELYYCRDNGNKPVQALPGINPVTTLGSNLGCTEVGGVCTDKTLGQPCGTSGTCQDLLKQSFFFRQ